MYSPSTFSAALLMTIVSGICWGSWANAYKGTRGYAFALFYWDYIFSALACTLLFAFTLGSQGSTGESFLANLAAADTQNILLALTAGVIFNVANLLLIAGMDMTGLAVAFPVTVGIAMVEGTALSYAIQPKGSIWFMVVGIALAVAAIIFDGLAYSKRGAAGAPVSRKGLTINVIAGLLLGAYSPFSTRALTNGHALTPYSVTVLFVVGAILCCFVANVYFMRHPLVGEAVRFNGFWKTSARNHLMGVVGGVVWGIGTTVNYIAAGFVGVPISYSIGQSAPMVAALWGVFVWKEFAGAPAVAGRYLALMFAFYSAAIGVIAMAYNT